MAPSVKRWTLGFSSSRNLTVCEFEPNIGLCTDSTGPAWDSLPPSLSAPPLLAHAFSLSLKRNGMVGEFVLAATTVDSRAAVAMVTQWGPVPSVISGVHSVSSSGHSSVSPSCPRALFPACFPQAASPAFP